MALGAQWLRSFGLMSYEIYLTHMFIVFAIVGLFHLSGAGLYFGWFGLFRSLVSHGVSVVSWTVSCHCLPTGGCAID